MASATPNIHNFSNIQAISKDDIYDIVVAYWHQLTVEKRNYEQQLAIQLLWHVLSFNEVTYDMWPNSTYYAIATILLILVLKLTINLAVHIILDRSSKMFLHVTPGYNF